MNNDEIETADTQRPEELAAKAPQVPFADAPCDAPGCAVPWAERVEFDDKAGQPQVRFACKRHAYLYLMKT